MRESHFYYVCTVEGDLHSFIKMSDWKSHYKFLCSLLQHRTKKWGDVTQVSQLLCKYKATLASKRQHLITTQNLLHVNINWKTMPFPSEMIRLPTITLHTSHDGRRNSNLHVVLPRQYGSNEASANKWVIIGDTPWLVEHRHLQLATPATFKKCLRA
jgi:hypothetical protein